MSEIRYYDDHELEGKTEAELNHMRLVSRVMDLDDSIDALELERMSDDELRAILRGERGTKERQLTRETLKKEKKPKERKQPVIKMKPSSIEDAFAVIDGRLMRRAVYRKGSETIEEHYPCGERVTWQGRVYYASIVAHYLTTGEWVQRVPKAAASTRYRAQVRIGDKVQHLGYYASEAERDAAVFAHRIGLVK